MSEQVEENYDELYSQGFNEGLEETNAEVEDTEEIDSGDLEQPTEEEEVEATEEIDESTDETTEESEEDSDDQEQEDIEPFMTIERFGEKIPLTKEEAIKMSQLGWDYTSKTQDLSTQRKRLEIIDGLPDEVLQALKDTSSGNKEAFASIADKFGIDPYDVEGVGEYKPQIIEKNYELEDVVDAIKADTANSSNIDAWINELPNNVGTLFSNNPTVLRGLHVDAQNGIANKIMPEVIKTMKLNPSADFVQTYQEVGKRVVSQHTEAKESKKTKPEASRETKKKAVPSKTKQSKHLKDHKSVWDDNDMFEKMRAKAGLTY